MVQIAYAATTLENAIELQREGRLKEADHDYREAIAELRAARNQAALLQALSRASWVSVSLGNYRDAIAQAREAVDLRHKLSDEKRLGDDLNTLALAHQNLGDYRAALDAFEQALGADRASGDQEGEITRLSNIGSIYFFQGGYADALRSYQQAREKVDAAGNAPWTARRLQIAVANLAAVHQRLGQDRVALDLYRSLAAPEAMPARERAQLVLNQGVLFRRMGDPIKALELYATAQKLYATDRYSDGEIGALRNIGIARAVDLHDLPGALTAFSAALERAEKSSNQRAIAQARLHRGEALRRLHRLSDADADGRAALDLARAAHLPEEQWKAEYLLGRVVGESGDSARARASFEQAIEHIESVRSALRAPALRTEFLADKRDVYDALIALRLRDSAPAAELFRWMEQSRARVLSEQTSQARDVTLATIQSRVPRETVLVETWSGADTSATLWISPSDAGVVHGSNSLLDGVPPAQHFLIVPDAAHSAVPFETLPFPATGRPVIETADVTYLPSSRFLMRESKRRRYWPWQREMLAFGDPPAPSSSLADEGWQRLPASASELRNIQQILPGRSSLHLADDAQKHYLTQTAPILHFATHALADPENPDRSRLLLANDYLFLGEVNGLDLTGVSLVTLSACDTARGKVVRGEGAQAFGSAFLSAGAAATVTSLWKVDDRITAAFMQQFYFFLTEGRTKAAALRETKLQFMRSQSNLADPRGWAAFIVTGDGWNRMPAVTSWTTLLLAGAAALLAIALIAWRTTARRSRQKAGMIASPGLR
jgi:tetratricopeptide (TPR) repeat protein